MESINQSRKWRSETNKLRMSQVNQLAEFNQSAYRMPLKDGTLFELKDNDLIMFKQVYTAIDVELELKKMIAWLVSNPSNRKTKRGIMRFINGWLSRAKPQPVQQQVSQRQYIQNTTLEERLSDDSWAQ